MNWKNILLHSDIYFAIVAIGTGLAAYAIYGLPLSDPIPLFIISALALNVCSTNRQIDEDTDDVNVPERTLFLREHGTKIFYLSVAVLALALLLAFARSPWAGTAALLTFIAGHFYSHPFPRVGRLREFFVIKNMTVGLMWALMALVTPLYFGMADPLVLAPLFLLFFMRMTFQTGLIDLRDVEGDAKAGVKTVPILLGKEKTLSLAHALNVVPLAIF
ncbi:MAG: UbiA family prenyltransferase, partial [Candidatus Micrarchaeota archaeon]